MKRRTLTTIGIMAAILMTVSGAETAFAKGGGGRGSGNGKGSGVNAGSGLSQKGNAPQHQYKQQNQYQYQHQYKQQNQHQYLQDQGASGAQPGNAAVQGDQVQSRNRTKLRDPSTH